MNAAHGFILGADGQTYRGLVASPDAARIDQEYSTNYSASTDCSFTLGTVRGRAERVIAIAGILPRPVNPRQELIRHLSGA